LAKNTIRLAVATLRVVLSAAVENGILASNPGLRLGRFIGSQKAAHEAQAKDQMGHSSIQVTMDTYGHLIPGADIAWVDRLDGKTTPQQNATPAQLAVRSGTEIPPEVVESSGGPAWIRTKNQQIMSLLL
jgi:hypothetical protein